MSITITDNNISVTEPDQSAILVTGTGDTVATNNSTIAFSSGPGSTLMVDGTNDRISLGRYGETLTLAHSGVNAMISAFDGASIHASGDDLQLSFAANGGNSQHLNLVGNDNNVSLNANFNTMGDSFTVVGDHNTVGGTFGVSSISVAGTGEVVNADDTFIGVSGSLAGAGSATINGSGDIINVYRADVSINGTGNTVYANETAINLTDGSSVTIIGGDNHVTADNAFIGLGTSLTSAGWAAIDGSGDFISVHGAGVGIGINGFGDTVFASNAEISLTAGSSATIFGGENHVTADDASITFRNTLTDVGSAIVDGSGDTIFVTSGGAMITVHGSHDTLIGTAGGDILGASGSNDTVHGGAGNDTFLIQGGSGMFFGGGGTDVFDFGDGGGQAHIINGGADSAGPSGELNFAVGISDDQLWFEQKGSDLSISVMGSHDHVTIDGWFGASASQLEEIKLSDGLEIDSGISQLVQAMASYSAANGGFDPASATHIPTDASLQAAVAASWHHV